MKRRETCEETIVIEGVCVEMTCDLCGRKAEFPQDEVLEWGGAGTGKGELSWHYTIDGEHESEESDLCYECASALAQAFKTRGRELLKICEAAHGEFLKAIFNI